MQSYNTIGSSPVSTPPVFLYVGYSAPKQRIGDLRAEALSSTSIRVRWNDWAMEADDVISGYRVRYSPVLSTLSPEIRAEAAAAVAAVADDARGASIEEIVVTEKSELVLSELRKYTEYQVGGGAAKLATIANCRFRSPATIVQATASRRAFARQHTKTCRGRWEFW